jgi:uncharacterized protein YodC (DUF2158 family)
MMSQYAVGSVVSLNSGGQGMTVERVDADSVACVWIDRDGRVRRDSFLGACLRLGDSRFDGIADLLIEGVTHTRPEIDACSKVAGNA